MPDAVVVSDTLKIARQRTLAMLAAAVAALLLSLAVLFYVLWMIFSTVKAVPFDADGVRCYKGADEMSCIKTDNPVK